MEECNKLSLTPLYHSPDLALWNSESLKHDFRQERGMWLLPTRVLELPPINRNWLEAIKKFRQGFIGAPDTAREGEKANKRSPFLLCPQGGQAFSWHKVRVGMCPEAGPGGWFRWFSPSLGSIGCRGHAQYSFCSWLFKSDSWFFGSLCIFGPEFVPTVPAHSYF